MPALLALLMGWAGLGTGCGRPMPSVVLPDALVAVVALESGEMVSILVELPRPGVEPIIRLADGAMAVDRGWARAVLLDGDLREGRSLTLIDLGSQTERTVEVESSFDLLNLGPEGMVLATAEGPLQVPMDQRLPATLLDRSPGPGGSLEHPGPAGGFHLRLEAGRLEILLPRADGTHWTPVLQGVERLLGSWWVVSLRLAPWQRRVVDDRFKQVGMILPREGEAQADGQLEEWRGTEAMRVDGPSQIVQGQRGWRGERDGAMGIAARASGTSGGVLAIRVRDDHVVAELDRLVLRQDGMEVQIPLDGDRATRSGPGWMAVSTRRRGFDQAVEIRLDHLDPSQLVVQLLDVDPGEAATLLATAPYPAMLAKGALALVPEGPDRPAPQ